MNLSKNKKLGIAFFVIGALIAYGVLSYMYKPHTTIEEQTITFKGTTSELVVKASSGDSGLTNGIVSLNGTTTSVSKEGFSLDGNVFCQPNDLSLLGALKEGEKIKIKGRFIGYDDLLEEVKLDQVILNNN